MMKKKIHLLKTSMAAHSRQGMCLLNLLLLLLLWFNLLLIFYEIPFFNVVVSYVTICYWPKLSVSILVLVTKDPRWLASVPCGFPSLIIWMGLISVTFAVYN